MKKLGLLFKETSENYIKDNLKKSEAVFVVKYSGLSSPDLSTLRQSLRNSNASLFVVKNSIARRALKGLSLEGLIKSLNGPCGLVFVRDEPLAASKVLYNFRKEHEQLMLEGGSLKGEILGTKEIEVLANLPRLEVLRTKLVIALNSPVSSFVRTLNQILAGFVYCLDQVRKKKS